MVGTPKKGRALGQTSVLPTTHSEPVNECMPCYHQLRSGSVHKLNCRYESGLNEGIGDYTPLEVQPKRSSQSRLNGTVLVAARHLKGLIASYYSAPIP